MFGEEDWDSPDFSSGAVTETNFENGQENSFSKSTSDTTKRTFIGRGRGKFHSPISGQFNNGQAPGFGGNKSPGNGFGRDDHQGFGGGGFKPRNNKFDRDDSSRDYRNGGFGGGGFKPSNNKFDRDDSSRDNRNGGFGGGGFKPRNNKFDRDDSSRDYRNGGSSNGDQGGFGGGGFKPRSKKCYKCGEEGHISRDCSGQSNGDQGNNDFGGFKNGNSRGNSFGGFKSNNSRKGGGGFTFDDNKDDSSGFGGFKNNNSRGGGGGFNFDDNKEGFNGSSFREGGFEKKSFGGDRGGFGSGKPRGNNCYKCGEEGHISRDCPSGGGDTRKKGCFKCGEEGHISRNCPTGGSGDNNDGGFGSRRGGFGGKRDSGGFGNDSNGFDGDSKPRGTDSGANDRVTIEKYIPPPPPEEEEEMFDSLQRGINFSKYDSIPVEVSGENCPKHINSFEEAHMTETIAKNVHRAKYEKPTPVQKYSIPIISAGRDLMACAQTGSGKTAAFLLPALTSMIKTGLQSSSFSEKQEPQAIIVGPTRELVNQIYLEARKFARGSICRACVAYGGTSVGYQLGEIRKGCNILIATPGRLIDFINKGRIGLTHVQFLILDEADRMLDMGFEEEIRKLASAEGMPPKDVRQTLMFSATFPDEIQKLAHDFLKEDFIFLTVGRVGGACSDVTQNIIQIDQNDKREKLHELLADVSQTRSRTLVFVETKRSADFLACSLSQSGYPTTSIHGDRLQREREEALRDFKRGEFPILIATSVAARGLDIPKVEHVINYDLPKDIDEYVHRIGRTGRCGNLGRATSFYDNSKDSEIARCLIRVLSDSLQEVPSWLEGCADGAIGTNFGTDRGGFGSRDARTKKGGGSAHNDKGFSNSKGRETGDYDYNDGEGFGTKSAFGANSGGGFGGEDDFGGGDENWD